MGLLQTASEVKQVIGQGWQLVRTGAKGIYVFIPQLPQAFGKAQVEAINSLKY